MIPLLEVEDVTQCAEGDTNFILVDRNNILTTGIDEIKSITDYRKTLEVQFYDEVIKEKEICVLKLLPCIFQSY